MKAFRQRLIVILIGIAVTLFVLEAGLRILGSFYAKRASRKSKADSCQYTVLCVGDSFVFGFGVPFEQSFPVQLQVLLDNKNPERRIKVVNRGVGAQTTTLLLQGLPYEISTIDPDLVIVLSGGANQWNSTGYYTYLKGNTVKAMLQDSFSRSAIVKLVKLLSFNIRNKMKEITCQRDNFDMQFAGGAFGKEREPMRDTLYNLNLGMRYIDERDYARARDLFQRMIARDPQDTAGYFGMGTVLTIQQFYTQATGFFQQAIELDPADARSYGGLALCYKENRDYQNALAWFKKALRLSPEDSRIYWNVGSIYLEQREFAEAEKWFSEAITRNPRDSRAYYYMGKFYKDQGKYVEALQWFDKGLRVDPQDWSNYYGFACVYSERNEFGQAVPWIKQGIKAAPASLENLNYRLIVYVFRQVMPYDEVVTFIRGIMQNAGVPRDVWEFYNARDIGQKEGAWLEHDLDSIARICKEKNIPVMFQNYPFGFDFASLVLQKVAEKNSIPFVDNRRVFDALWEKGEKRGDYSVPDGHCNGKGYGVIANNIYEKLIELGWFDPGKKIGN
ncbi:MAG: tetratricopeptide repeat protein [Candidatus Omnitrophota bacterium]|jgi:tetratricopeptide (TPR) repeat protein